MRLLSYNIHKGIGGRDRRYEFARVIDVIETENPDLACLQEVDRHVRARITTISRTCWPSISRRKAICFSPTCISAPASTEPDPVALAAAEQASDFAAAERKEAARAQLAVVETPEGPLHLVHLHLGLGERERHWQIEHLVGHHLFQEAAHLPTLLVGDTNDWRNTLADGMLGLRGFRHWTAPISRFRTFPAWLPLGSLDKLFVRGQVFLRHAAWCIRGWRGGHRIICPWWSIST